MNYFTTELMKNLFANENNLPAFEQTVTELFRSQLEKSLNEILAYELTAFLDYERYERSDNLNSRNGSYQRKLDTKYGQITLNFPRDRLGEFYTSLISRYRRRDFSTEETILDLYEEGMTNTEIANIIQKLCGTRYSKQTISNITDKALESIESFKNRPLNKEYAVVFLDGTSMALRRDTVAKEMVHIGLGITVEGTKEILGYLKHLQNQLKHGPGFFTASRTAVLKEFLYSVWTAFPAWRMSLKTYSHSPISSAALYIYREISLIRHVWLTESRLPPTLSRSTSQGIKRLHRRTWTVSLAGGARNIHP